MPQWAIPVHIRFFYQFKMGFCVVACKMGVWSLGLWSCKNPTLNSYQVRATPTTAVGPIKSTTPHNQNPAETPCTPQGASLYFQGSDAVSPDVVSLELAPCPSPEAPPVVPDEGPPPAQDLPSPNFQSRGSASIQGIVLHHTNGNFQSALTTLRDGNRKAQQGGRVSAHVLIGRDGKMARLVDDSKAAWHALQMNPTTLGVELEGESKHASQGLASEQEKILLQQLRFWMKKYNIPLDKITNHRDHVATECPSFHWATKEVFLKWRASKSAVLQ